MANTNSAPKQGPQKPQAHPGAGSKNAGAPVPDACTVKGCKTKVERFSFCSEHYEQFKFGLVKKDGTNAADFEKKFDHYQAYKKGLAGRKAA